MKIINFLNEKGKPFEIPGASRDDLPEFFVDMGYRVGAEIGVLKGEFSVKFCQVGIKMYAIDPWLACHRYHQGNIKKQEEQDKVFEEASFLLKPYDCTIIKKSSEDALVDFEDESLDFVYIDANHSFKHIAFDLHEWSLKVRKGGVISGHDYYVSKAIRHWNINHVKPVVNAFIESFHIKKFYVLGERYTPNRDQWRSYFWIKE
jgi:hypothetical protein